MPYPDKLGQPCWDARQVEHVLTITAQTNEQSADAFLAAHSPFRFIRNFRDPNGPELGEEEVYQTIFGRHGEVQAAIKGEPGTGKSHLVHWLKLRADYEAANGNADAARLVRILVQRGNGSLKDVLRQMLERLGEEFREHTRLLQGAIDKVSAETARAMLLSELALELDPRWGRERTGRPRFNKKLRMLAPALRSQGVSQWLLRQGGVIDQNIRRLTEGAAPAEQDQWPQFTLEELSPPATYLSTADNAANVHELFKEDFYVEPQRRQEAVDTLNLVLHDALTSLTGISGTGLRELFDHIRRDLFKQGRELALFIEDVSVTGLDREVINALEPQRRDKLCRMVAVIGVTSNAWIPLEENQKERFDPVFEVGAGVTARWSSDAGEVARFTARYLNAIRSTDQEIAAMARQRRERGGEADVPQSKCDDCPRKPECHPAFGAIALADGVEIGLFPFTPRAPHALLAGLSDESDRVVRRSQRGLIENVLIPVLQNSRPALENEEFPRPAQIPVRLTVPTFWAGFSHTYGAGEMSKENRDRLQLLAEYWAGGDDEDELAAGLQPLLEPLGLPKLARAPKKPPGGKPPIVTGDGPPPPPPPPPPPAALQKKLQTLEQWSRGQTLSGDGEFRDLLRDFFVRSIPWADQRGLPMAESKGITNSKGPINSNKFPKIEGQAGSPAAQTKSYNLPRDAETRELLEALLQFSLAGRGNWNFSHGELYKRQVWRWLRRHRQEVVAAAQPPPAVQPTEAAAEAARALAVAAVLRDRKALPREEDERLARLFTPVWSEDATPEGFAAPLRDVIAHLERRHGELKEFLISELGAGQGDSPPKDFLDPRPLLAALKEEGPPALGGLSPEFHKSYWDKRFAALRGLAAFANLPQRLDAEQAKAAETVAEIRALLEECGADLSADLRAGFTEWLGAFVELIEVQRGSGKVRKFKEDVPHPAFETLWGDGLFKTQEQRDRLAATLAGADALLAESTKLERWLAVDPLPLRKLYSALITARLHLEKIDRLLTLNEEHLNAEGGGNQDALLAELGALAALPDALTTPNHESE